MTNDPEEIRKLAGIGSEQEASEEEAVSPVLPFDVDYTTPQKKRLQGRFVYRVPAIGKQIDIARMKAVYLPNGAAADPNGALLVEMVSYLDQTLEEKPAWWRPHEFYDHGVISHVYGRCLKHEAKFLRKDTEDGQDEGGLHSGEEDSSPASTDGAGNLDGHVSASRKRREVFTANDS